MAFSATGTSYHLTGPADAPPVVLVHGLGLTRDTFAQHLPALAAQHRVLSYDLLGHGQTPPADHPLTLTSFSVQLQRLMDEVEMASAAIIGFSLGGMINRRFAIDHSSRCDALVVLNSPHERGDEAQRQVEQRARDSAAGGPGANIDVTLARWFTPEFLAERPDMVDAVKAWVLANEPEPYAHARQVLAEGVIEIIRPDPPITKPTLVMTCENDTGSTPAMSQAIAAETPGAETIIVPGLQHLGLLEAPDRFTQPILTFLENLAHRRTP